MAERLPPMDDRELIEALAELGRTTPYPPTPDLASAVAARVAELGPPPQPSWLDRLPWSTQHFVLLAIAVVALVGGLVVFPTADRSPPEAPRLVVVFGGDLSEVERAELEARFAPRRADVAVEIQSVSYQELVTTLEAAQIPVAPDDAAVSSVAIMCNPSAEQGLHIRTEHLSRLRPQDYAHMLLIAGVQQADVQISAPAGRQVTGETALVGVLRGSGQCHPGGELDSRRVELAYAYLARAMELSDGTGELGPASAFMAETTEAVIGGLVPDASSLAPLFEAAERRAGLTVQPLQRAQLVPFFESLATLEYGPYGQGYDVLQPHSDEVLLVPSRSAPAHESSPGKEVDRN